MAILKILITSPNPQNSVIFIDDEQYIPNHPKYETKELKHLIEDMLQGLFDEKFNEVVGKISLFSIIPQQKCEIAKIEPFLFRKRGAWYSAVDVERHVCEKVAEVIGLISWIENEDMYFKNNTDTLRHCMICKKSQSGKITGYANMSHSPIVKWPSDYCFNKKCFSHKIWKAIDVSHTPPKDIPYNETGIKK